MRRDNHIPRVTEGQRVVLPRDPVTGTLPVSPQVLLRGEDPAVNSWQVNLAPIYRLSVGPVAVGMPGFAFPAKLTGNPQVTLTYGGVGVSFRYDFAYPKVGTSFTVSGDNVQIVVASGDNITVFAEADTPVLSGWLKPVGVPTAPQPLLIGFEFDLPLYGPREIFPYCRALHVSGNTPGATVTVVLESETGTNTTFVIPSGTGVHRIPIASQNYRVTATPSGVSTCAVAQELVFT